LNIQNRGKSIRFLIEKPNFYVPRPFFHRFWSWKCEFLRTETISSWSKVRYADFDELFDDESPKYELSTTTYCDQKWSIQSPKTHDISFKGPI